MFLKFCVFQLAAVLQCYGPGCLVFMTHLLAFVRPHAVVRQHLRHHLAQLARLLGSRAGLKKGKESRHAKQSQGDEERERERERDHASEREEQSHRNVDETCLRIYIYRSTPCETYRCLQHYYRRQEPKPLTNNSFATSRIRARNFQAQACDVLGMRF